MMFLELAVFLALWSTFYVIPWIYQRIYWGRVHMCHIGWRTTIDGSFLDVSSIKDRAVLMASSVKNSTAADHAELCHSHVRYSYVTDHAMLQGSRADGCDISGHVFLAHCYVSDSILEGDVSLSILANVIEIHWWRDVP